MAEIINLRMARKARARSDRDRQAAENRVIHGRTKAEKQKDRMEKSIAGRALDGHLRESQAPDGKGGGDGQGHSGD